MTYEQPVKFSLRKGATQKIEAIIYSIMLWPCTLGPGVVRISNPCKQIASFPVSPCRYHLPVWWPVWGGCVGEPECNQCLPRPQAVGTDLLLWPSSAGLRAGSVAGQVRKCEGGTGTALQTCQGKPAQLVDYQGCRWLFTLLLFKGAGGKPAEANC